MYPTQRTYFATALWRQNNRFWVWLFKVQQVSLLNVGFKGVSYEAGAGILIPLQRFSSA